MLEYENRLKGYWIKEVEQGFILYIQYDNKFDAVYSMQIVLENFGNIVKDNLVQLNKSESELVYQESFEGQKSRFVEIQTASRFVDKSYTVIIKNILIFDNLKSEEEYQ